MNLAWKEIKFYKFRFILIMLIVFLMSTMVLFISGLAQGLARENISLFDHLKGNQFIIQKMKEPQLEKSSLNSKQQFKISKIVNEQPIKMMSKTLNIKGNEENVVALNYTTENKFNLKQLLIKLRFQYFVTDILCLIQRLSVKLLEQHMSFD